MSTAPAKKELRQKRAILKDVFIDNLGQSQSRAPLVRKRKGGGASSLLWNSVFFPVMFSFFAMLVLVSQMNSRVAGNFEDDKGFSLSGVVSQWEGEGFPPPWEGEPLAGTGLLRGTTLSSLRSLHSPAERFYEAMRLPQEAPPPPARPVLRTHAEAPVQDGPDGMVPNPHSKIFSSADLAARFIKGLGLNLPDEVSSHDESGVSLLHNFAGFANNSEISLARLFGLGVKTIVIDPGHGGRDPGAIGPGGLLEKDVTLRIALKLRDRLQKHPGYRILMTRDSDEWVSLKDRVRFANEHQADLFISIHVNALEQQHLNIIETYYFGAPTDAQSLRLAEAENEGSEYLMAEFKGMIKKIGDQFKQQESRVLALSIQKSLYRHLKRQDEKIINRGVKTAPFVVLLGADMPSVLAEIACISNPGEEKRLAESSYLNEVASHLEHGIANYLNDRLSRRILTDGAKQDGKQRADGKG